MTRHAWTDLQDTRNANATYKMLTASKYGSGGQRLGGICRRAGRRTTPRESARKVAHLYYGHRNQEWRCEDGSRRHAAADGTADPGHQG